MLLWQLSILRKLKEKINVIWNDVTVSVHLLKCPYGVSDMHELMHCLFFVTSAYVHSSYCHLPTVSEHLMWILGWLLNATK